ncbi:MAG TPA: nickel pincer cofactor biosynthesis protein LarC [Thermodesulfobacteriota bacterium]|nr:nickel pincer cofactor biosynthesis protein LarC [Thermodesulfobacteriota bacterium]
MRTAYFDCFSGASGDMILGALIDAGLSPRRLREALKRLQIPTVHLKVTKVLKRGIAGTRVSVEGGNGKKSHRNLTEVLRIVKRSRVEPEVKEKSEEIFKRIASAEAKIHGIPAEEVHFHELGGLDSIVDIVGSVWGIREMGIEKLHVSQVNVGGGFVKCEHGILPVPAPAALSLMEGKPIYSSGVERELLTPTGAAILSTLGSEFGSMPRIKVERIGYGAGRDDLPHPNLLRLLIGTSESFSGKETVAVIETNIDDMNPQFYDYVMEKLLASEALEVFVTPILMKKNRPGHLLTVICPSEKLPSVAKFLFQETTTLGLRWRVEEREKTDREIQPLRTKYGRIRFKLARWGGSVVNLSPEYEDCKRLALERGVPLKDIFEEAKSVALIFQKDGAKASSSRRKRAVST